MTAEDRLQRALAMALERYAEMMNEPFATPADVVAVPGADFWAVVRMRGEGCEISRRCFARVIRIWPTTPKTWQRCR